MKAAQKIVPTAATSMAYMASLLISVTTIAESTVYFVCFAMLTVKLDTTIGCHSNLSIMKSGCFLDLLFDQVKCVHLSYLKY